MNRKVSMGIICVMLASLLLAACSQSNDSTSPSSSNAPAETSSTPAASTAAPENLDPLGKYDPPISLEIGYGRMDADVKLPEGETPDNNTWSKMINDTLGIKLTAKYAMAKGDELNQKINALAASADLPDMFNIDGSNTQQFNQLIEAGAIQDLTDVFNKYATPLVKELLPPDSLEPIMNQGKLYAIPHLVDTSEDGYMIWIRTDWLNNLSLQEPKTMQDLLAIADAFTHKDPDQNGKSDTYGIVADSTLGTWFSLSGIFSGYHAYPNIWIKDASGNLVNGSIQPEMKTALQTLQDLYKNGILSKEWSINTGDQTQQDLINGKVGIYFAKNWASEIPLQQNIDKDPKADWKAVPFVSIDDKPALAVKNALKITNLFVVRKGVENPEALIKMLNLTAEKYYGSNPMIDPPKSSLWKMAPISIEPFGKNIRKYLSVQEALKANSPDKLDAAAKVKYDAVTAFNGGDKSKWGAAREYGPGGSFGILNDYKQNNQFQINEFYGLPTESMGLKQSVLDKALVEMVIKVISGDDIATFDEFVANWKKLGGDDITKEVNEWYKNK